jgi:regulator of sigma E protease
MIFYTALTLGILVFIHELGHFLAAKLTGMRVDRFSIGYPPRAFGKKIGETDYCISWVPFGGYVKIAGMVDESFDTDFLEHEPQPWEYRAKPIWARMFVITAGVIMNVLLAVCIFWGINYTHGKLIEETTEIGRVVSGSIADSAGLHVGDRILSINNQPVTHWDEIFSEIYVDNFGKDISITVERQGTQQHLLITRTMMPDNSQRPLGIIEAHTVVAVGAVDPGAPADKLGLKSGDILVALDNVPITNDSSVIKTVREHVGKELKVTWKRGEELLSGTTTPGENGRIGIRLSYFYNGPQKTVNYSLFEALQMGVSNVIQSTGLFIKSIGQMIAGKSSFKENIGGPIAIAKFATQSAEIGVTAFLAFLAMLSMSLALLNILPFPALDGGHLIMLIYEKIFHREIPHNVKLNIQKAGVIILLAFMAFVVYNDISRL